MNWFKHDSDASTDAKVKKLLIRYGAEGYAIYFHCLELIVGDVNENNITFELEHDAEIIADNLKIKGTADLSGVERVNEIMRYIVDLGLFQEQNGHIFCFKLLKRLDSSMTSNANFRTMIADAKKNHDAIMISHDTIMQDQTRRDKIRKEEKKSGQTSAECTINDELNKSDDIHLECCRIIDYLNQESCKHFRYTQSNLKHIKARLKDGFVFDDFRLVIDYKVNTWGRDPKMSEYVRPETLFGTKMESYREEIR